MKLTAQMFQEIIKHIISERKWNKNSKTPRDYSKEYNPPGSKEQDERNKRKRDKRKHDKEHGKCPEGEELHHLGGIEGDELQCEPVSKNRGRKEKSRLKKGEIVIKITESQLKKIIEEETKIVLKESDIDKIPSVAGSTNGIPKSISQQGAGAVQNPSSASKDNTKTKAVELKKTKAKAAQLEKTKAKAAALEKKKIDAEFAELTAKPIDDLGSGSSLRAEAKNDYP
tara:strand:- start:11093 stop:11773 length:681 start_codon:yes stop_codon:yes gene_type:complete